VNVAPSAACPARSVNVSLTAPGGGSGNAPEPGCDLRLSERFLIGSTLSKPPCLLGVAAVGASPFDEPGTAAPAVVVAPPAPLPLAPAATRNGNRAISFH